VTRSSTHRVQPPTIARDDSPYRRDFYGWAREQADRIRRRRLDDADLDNIAEELDGLARGEYREMRSYLMRILQHLLKRDHQPSRRTRSWVNSVAIHRAHAAQHLEENPSLRPQLDELVTEAYRLALPYAVRDTKLPRKTFPDRSAYDFQTIVMRDIRLADADE